MYQMYNTTEDQWQALEKIKKEAYEQGRQAGFAAGYEAAQGQPKEKIEAAYEQGLRAGQQKELLRKNGVGY